MLLLGAYLISWLAVDVGLPFGLAVLAAMAALGVFGAGFHRVALRRVVGQPTFVLVMITIGAGIAVTAGVSAIFGDNQRLLGDPWGSSAFHVGSITITWVKLSGIVVAAAGLAVYFAFDRYTRWGLAMRATAADEEATLSAGVPVRRVHALTWALAGGLATLGGLFLAGFPMRPRRRLGDAALRAFPPSCSAACRPRSARSRAVPHRGRGGDDLGLRAVVAGDELLRRRPLRRDDRDPAGAALRAAGRQAGGAPVMSRRLALLAFTGFALVLPFGLSASNLTTATFVVIAAIGATGLNVLVGYAGQISLGHAFFLAAGAYTGAVLGGDHGVSAALWIPAAGAVAALFGALVGPDGPAPARPVPGHRHARHRLHRPARAAQRARASRAGRRAGRSRRSSSGRSTSRPARRCSWAA
jgi:ABC-type branched-subunit amino acid transport system permease subunit